MSKEKQKQKKILNRRAKYDYEIHSQIETGIILKGNEVKSIRFGKVVLDNAYAVIKKRGNLDDEYVYRFEKNIIKSLKVLII